MTIWYIDPAGGNDANDGLSFANRKKSFKNLRRSVRPGDTVRVKQTVASRTPSLLTGQSMQAYYTYDPVFNLNHVYYLNVANHLQIGVKTSSESWTWVASAGVTITQTSTSQQRKISLSFSLPTFAGGKMAYATLPATLDLSAYDTLIAQLGRDIRTNNVTGSGWAQSTTKLRLCLCTDTAGNTINKEIDVTGMCGPDHLFSMLTVGAMSSAIKSIAIYLDNPLTSGGDTLALYAITAGKSAGVLPGDLLYMNSTASLPMLVHGLWDTNVITVSNYTKETSYRVVTSALYRLRMNYVNDNSVNSWLNHLALGYTVNYAGESISLVESPTMRGKKQGAYPSEFAKVTISGGWDTTAMASQTGYSLHAFSGSSLDEASVDPPLSQRFDRFGYFVFGEVGILAEGRNNYIEASDCPYLPLGVSKWDSTCWAFAADSNNVPGSGQLAAYAQESVAFNGLGIVLKDDLTVFWNIYSLNEYGKRSSTPFFTSGAIAYADVIETQATSLTHVPEGSPYAIAFNESGWTADSVIKSSFLTIGTLSYAVAPVGASLAHNQEGHVTSGLPGYAANSNYGTISVVSDQLRMVVAADRDIGWLYFGAPGDYVVAIEFTCTSAMAPFKAIWDSGMALVPDYVPANTRAQVELHIALPTAGFAKIMTTTDAGATLFSFKVMQT